MSPLNNLRGSAADDRREEEDPRSSWPWPGSAPLPGRYPDPAAAHGRALFASSGPSRSQDLDTRADRLVRRPGARLRRLFGGGFESAPAGRPAWWDGVSHVVTRPAREHVTQPARSSLNPRERTSSRRARGLSDVLGGYPTISRAAAPDAAADRGARLSARKGLRRIPRTPGQRSPPVGIGRRCHGNSLPSR